MKPPLLTTSRLTAPDLRRWVLGSILGLTIGTVAVPLIVAQPATDGTAADNLDPLVADLATAFPPRFIADRILTLSAERGATTVPSAQPGLGAVWIHDAEVTATGPREVRFHATAFGWRWADRTTE